MATEARRAAQALVATRAQSFPSRYSRPESVQRLNTSLGAIEKDSASRAAVRGMVTGDRVVLAFARRLGERSQCTFEGSWVAEGDAVRLDGSFLPVTRTKHFLASMSVVLSILILASLWVLVAPDQEASTRILVPMITVLSVFAFPFVVVAMASHREIEEMAISKVVRRALEPQEQTGSRPTPG